MKRKILVSLVILGVCAGCGKIPTLKNGEEALVTFKNEKQAISVTDLYSEIKSSSLSKLIDMIDKKILLDKYPNKEKEAKKSVEEQFESIKSYYVDEDGKYDENSLLQALSSYYGISTVDEFKEMLSLSYYRNLAVKDYAKKSISDDEIEKYYDENIVGDISCKHILITPDTTDDMTDKEKEKAEAKALKTAKEVIEKLKKGEKFDDLAKKYSNDDSNKDKGGDLGYFNKGDMVAEFEAAAYKLKVDKYTTEPVKTEYGYHIILKTGEKEKASLKDSKKTIIKNLSEEKINNDATIQINALVELRKDYKMDIQDDELAKLYNNYISNQLLQIQSKNNSEE